MVTMMLVRTSCMLHTTMGQPCWLLHCCIAAALLEAMSNGSEHGAGKCTPM
jgi:hypothetical protein